MQPCWHTRDTCIVLNSFDFEPFIGLLGSGNAAPFVRYTWNAENRLIRVEPGGPPAEGDRKVEFAYDYLGRRIEKRVYTWDPNLAGGAGDWSPTPTLHRKFVWSGPPGAAPGLNGQVGVAGWLLLAELDGLNGDAVVRKYTWGLDLAGLNGAGVSGAAAAGLQSAGGIGGLLAVHQAPIDNPDPEPDIPAGDYIYLYDANGNVGQVVAWAANYGGTAGYAWDTDPPGLVRLVARYEYDPYGGVIAPDDDGDSDWRDDAGPYAVENPIRFSTKYFDDETELYYFGYRYYLPRLGRWISRDPLEELGGPNLYAYALCNPMGLLDPYGDRTISFELNAAVPGTGLSFYGRLEATDEACGIDVALFLAAEWQPPGLRGIDKLLSRVAGIHVEAGARGGLKGSVSAACGTCLDDAKICGRVEVFLRIERRAKGVQEWGRRKRFTRVRFGAGADGGVDVCWSACTGDVTVSGQISWWAYGNFGFWKWNRSYDYGGSWEFLDVHIANISYAPLKKYCCGG